MTERFGDLGLIAWPLLACSATLTEGEMLLVNGERVEQSDLVARVRALASQRGAAAVFVSADARVQFGTVAAVFDSLREARVGKVFLRTRIAAR